MKIQLERLTLRNFMSYGNIDTVIPLQRPGTTLIVGEDMDNTNDGKSANGTGKSTIINALSYALYDKAVSSISKDKLVNNINKKNMVVTLEYSVGNVKYKIIRERKTKAGAEGNSTYFYVDGVDKTRSAADTNRDIEATLGIPHELFVRIVVFSASHQPFLDLPATAQVGPNQKDFIEELFGLTSLTAKATRLKEVMKDLKSSIDTKRVFINSKEAEHARHQALIDSTFNRVLAWEDTTAETITTLKAKLEWAKKVNVDEQKQFLARFDSLNAELKDLTTQYQPHAAKIAECNKKLRSIDSELAHLNDGNCPYCKQEFHSSDDIKAALAVDKLDADNTLAITLPLAADIATKMQVIQTELDELDGKIQLTMSQLISLTSEQDVITQKIADLEVATNPHLESLDELKAVKLDEINYDEVNDLTRTLEHQEFLLKLLTKKDSFVRKALLDKSLPYLNAQLKLYLSQLGLPHTVEFTHEMTANISRFGTPLDFGNLSNGQRARVNIALSFAFRNVLQSLHSSINICMLDEIFDVGLDTVGVQLATKLVKHKTREEGISMYIISHRDEVFSLFDNVLTVQYSKGFSTLIDPLANIVEAEEI